MWTRWRSWSPAAPTPTPPLKVPIVMFKIVSVPLVYNLSKIQKVVQVPMQSSCALSGTSSKRLIGKMCQLPHIINVVAKKSITYWFGVHQFWQFWRYCIYCYLSWYSTCFTYIDIAISPCATLICTYFDFLDIVVYLPKALLICYFFYIFWFEWLPLFW